MGIKTNSATFLNDARSQISVDPSRQANHMLDIKLCVQMKVQSNSS